MSVMSKMVTNYCIISYSGQLKLGSDSTDIDVSYFNKTMKPSNNNDKQIGSHCFKNMCHYLGILL